jgi:deoxyribonuclease IV
VRIGAHIRTHGGLPSVVPGAVAVGAEAVQFFASNPRNWRHPNVTDEAAAEFRGAAKANGIRSAYLHSPYLVNIASPNPEFLRKSVELSRASLAAADALGAAGLVVHAGAGGTGEPAEALERAARSLDAIAEVESDAAVVVELMAGSRGAVASTFDQAAALFEATAGTDRLRLCIDTCHLFAAGYALDEAEGVKECFAELRRSGLGPRLVLVHANDAAHERGSGRDRHANIGVGGIGEAGFAAILSQPAVRRCTVVIETAGDEATRRRDVETLRRLAEAGARGPRAGAAR